MPFRKKPDSRQLLWDEALRLLLRLRGEGAWRGDVIQLRNQWRIRIPLFGRGHGRGQEIWMDFMPEKVTASLKPSGPVWENAHGPEGMEPFLRKILLFARNGEYTHTRPDRATYRNNPS